VTDAAVVDPPMLGDTFQHFLEFLKEPGLPAPVLSPRRFSQALHIDLQTLAEQAHVHRNTIARAPASRGVQDYLRESLRVIKAATDVSGDVNKALFWYRNEPLSAFGFKTAETLVSAGRTEAVLKYVMSIEAGASG
jgi:hypothetical protein